MSDLYLIILVAPGGALTVAMILDWLLNKEGSLISQWYVSLKGLLTKTSDKLKKENSLLKCNKCNRLSRIYQVKLYLAKVEGDDRSGFYYCPHCEEKFSRGEYLKRIKTEDSWMKTHPDCPKIKKKDLKNIEDTIENLKKSHEEIAEMKRFEEYNKISVDLKWVENTRKTKGNN